MYCEKTTQSAVKAPSSSSHGFVFVGGDGDERT